MRRYQAVIGLGFGDEGKGLVTDYLCSQATKPLVIRFSGGQQAGHTVIFNGIRHVFANFGAGTLRGIPSYFAKYCTVEPVGLINELLILLEKGITPLLMLDAECPITTPYDIAANQQHYINGSCGVGVGDTLNREEHFYSLTFSDLFYPWVLKTKLENIKNFYAYLTTPVELGDFLECCEFISHSPYIQISYGIPQNYHEIIFEGSQGLLLDQHYGFFPHVTRSNTGSKNILDLLGDSEIEFYLVTRAYQTRHGKGAMSNENLPHNIKINPDETNINNFYQGEFRRTLLDVSLLEYALNKDAAIRKSSNKTLVITCLDQIQNEYRFTYQNNLVYCQNETEFVKQIADILNIRQVYLSSSPESKAIYKAVQS